MASLFRRSKSWKEWFDEGRAHGGAQRFDQAEAAFREAIHLAPDEPYPHYELGYTLSLQGRYSEALDEFRRTDRLATGFFLVQTEAHVCELIVSRRITEEVARILRHLQHLTDWGQAHSEEAVDASRQVIAAVPECALGHFFLGKAMFDRDPVEATRALERCLELDPDDTTAINARFHLGVLAREAGRMEDALKLWNGIVRDYPDNPHIRFARGMVQDGPE